MLLSSHAAAMVFLAARRQWIHRLRPETVQGSDLHMMRWCIAEQTRAYAFFSISLGCADDAAFEARRDEVLAGLTAALEDPRCSLRRGMDLARRRYTWRDDLTLDTLVEHCADDASFYRVDDDDKRELVIRFHSQRRILGYLFDHTCWDGIRIVNECVVPAIRCKPFSSKWLVADQYRPVLSEALMIYTGYRAGLRALTHRALPTLDDAHQQRVIKHTWATDEVKSLKNRLGVSFSAAIVALYGREVLRWLPETRERVRMGVIIGFESARFRNNYSIISVDIRRHGSVDVAVQDVADQLRRRKVEVMGLYHLVNTIEVETLFKRQLVDVLFSPAFFDRGEGVSVDVDDMSFYNVPCSTPLYAFACSIDAEIRICTTVNCPEVAMERALDGADRRFVYTADKVLVEEPLG